MAKKHEYICTKCPKRVESDKLYQRRKRCPRCGALMVPKLSSAIHIPGHMGTRRKA